MTVGFRNYAQIRLYLHIYKSINLRYLVRISLYIERIFLLKLSFDTVVYVLNMIESNMETRRQAGNLPVSATGFKTLETDGKLVIQGVSKNRLPFEFKR